MARQTQRPKIDQLALDRSLCEERLSYFVKYFWPVIEPTTRMTWNWHLDLICEYLEALAVGDITRLIINVMPRSGKSLLCSVFYPTWIWTKHPERRMMCVSYAANLSVKFNTDRRTLIQSPLYQKMWGTRVRLAADQNRQSQFQNTARGHMLASSVDGGVTGQGGDDIFVDDALNPEQSNSDIERRHSVRWFDETLATRLDNPKTGRVLVVEQRTHTDDVSGHLLELGGWVHLSLPAKFDRATTYTFPRSGRMVVRNADDYLWPERMGHSELEEVKRAVGAFAFRTQYLQQPVARGGNIFKLDSLRRYSVLPRRFDRVVMSLDTAFKTSTTNDYSALVVIGEVRERTGADMPGYYLLFSYRTHAEFSRLKSLTIDFASRYRPTIILVEDAASGQSLIQELKKDTNLPIKAIKPDTDKMSRALAIEPSIEAGRFLLPEDSAGAWVVDFVNELITFPAGGHDDQVDALTQAINWLRHAPSGEWVARSLSTGEIIGQSGGRRRLDQTLYRPGIGTRFVEMTLQEKIALSRRR